MKCIIGIVACLILAQLTVSSPMPTKEDTADAIVNDATELEEDRDSKCKTIGDPNPNVTCVIPFIYKRKKYYKCPWAADNAYAWCPTSVNANGQMASSTAWGRCGAGCPTYTGVLQHGGEDCWEGCGQKQGLCDWCGKGNLCCNFGWYDKSGGCDGTIGVPGKGHVCSSAAASKPVIYETTVGGQPCVFPLIYKGKTYEQCTSRDSKMGWTWCATTKSYETDEKWGYCKSGIPKCKSIKSETGCNAAGCRWKWYWKSYCS